MAAFFWGVASVALHTFGTAYLAPTNSELMSARCPRGGKNLRAAVLGVASAGGTEPLGETGVESQFPVRRGTWFAFVFIFRLILCVLTLGQNERNPDGLAVPKQNFPRRIQGQLTDPICPFSGLTWPYYHAFVTLDRKSDTPEEQLKQWKRERKGGSAGRDEGVLHPNALLPRARPK